MFTNLLNNYAISENINEIMLYASAYCDIINDYILFKVVNWFMLGLCVSSNFIPNAKVICDLCSA